jgi:hypothetical protein
MGSVTKVVENLEVEFSKVKIVSGQDSLIFGYGDKKELDAIIKGKSENGMRMYPLVWYLMPNEVEYNDYEASANFTFIIAHNSDTEYLNDQRFKLIYDTILFPYLENVLNQLQRPSLVIASKEYKITEYPNYSDGGKNSQIDCWDALKLDIDLKISNGLIC